MDVFCGITLHWNMKERLIIIYIAVIITTLEQDVLLLN